MTKEKKLLLQSLLKQYKQSIKEQPGMTFNTPSGKDYIKKEVPASFSINFSVFFPQKKSNVITIKIENQNVTDDFRSVLIDIYYQLEKKLKGKITWGTTKSLLQLNINILGGTNPEQIKNQILKTIKFFKFRMYFFK